MPKGDLHFVPVLLFWNSEWYDSWFIYAEAGTCKELVNISHPKNSKTEIHLPENVVGSEIHLILEVTDDKPIGSLSDYRRIVIQVK